MIYIGLGANLKNGEDGPIESVCKAVDIISALPDLNINDASRIWHSPAFPDDTDPEFSNAIIQCSTSLKPLELLYSLRYIEQCFGRVRTVQNAPRVLDLDIISYHDDIINDTDIVIPHSRMHERSFVLYPLRDVAPDFIHPMSGLSVSDMINALPLGHIIRVNDDMRVL